jgi:hypothetical protein
MARPESIKNSYFGGNNYLKQAIIIIIWTSWPTGCLNYRSTKTKQKQNKKETKRSNHQTVIKNQWNYSNPYQATSILLQVSNERVEIAPLNNIDATTKYVHHILNVLIIDHHPDDRRWESSICTSGRKKESVFRATSWTIYLKSNLRQQIWTVNKALDQFEQENHWVFSTPRQ